MPRKSLQKRQIHEKTKNQKTKREEKIKRQLTKTSPESCYQEYRYKKAKDKKTKQRDHLNHLILAAKYHIAASFLLQNLLVDVCWTRPVSYNIKIIGSDLKQSIRFVAIFRFTDFLPSPGPGTIS